MTSGVVALGQVADRRQVGDDAVHGEHAVGRDQAEAAVLGLLAAGLQRGHVVVGVAQAPRLAEPDAVDHRGVVEGIGDDRVLRPQQGLEQAGVGIEAGGIEDRILHPEKAGEALFERLVLLLGAADEAHRSHPVAIAIEGRLGSPHQPGIIGQAEVVVGAEVEDLAPAGHRDGRILRRGDHPFRLVETGLLQVGERAAEVLIERRHHGSLPLDCRSGDPSGSGTGGRQKLRLGRIVQCFSRGANAPRPGSSARIATVDRQARRR